MNSKAISIALSLVYFSSNGCSSTSESEKGNNSAGSDDSVKVGLQSESGLTCSLESARHYYNKGQEIQVKVSFKNSSQSEISFYRDSSPFDSVHAKQFKIVDANGNEIDYLGKMVKREPSDEVITISSNDIYEDAYTIEDMYDFDQVGIYKLSLLRDFIFIENNGEKKLEKLPCGEISIDLREQE